MNFIKTKEAVEILGNEITQETLQTWIRYGNCPLGEYIVKEGNSRGQYICFKDACEFVRDKGILPLMMYSKDAFNILLNQYISEQKISN